MFFKLLELFRSFFMFTGSYSNNVFYDPLSSEEEEKYIKLMLMGDKDARNKLIEHNLRLVAHIVKKFDSKSIDQDDLISIGTIGLIKGVDSYSLKHGTKITTYCARCIENEILMYFRSNNKNEKNISLNEPIGFDKDGNEITVMDVLKLPSPDFALDIQTKDNILLLKKYIEILNDREREIIIKRYGLDNNQELTQKAIAKELNISRSYVSRIEKRALTKIFREFMKENNKK
ncbi:MAG: RNA polymerase sporulation sigma factor SigK [Bacilli bacterium]|nr:RNA polymerase sporulation sigma factor SigK [Bacilli bacterium]